MVLSPPFCFWCLTHFLSFSKASFLFFMTPFPTSLVSRLPSDSLPALLFTPMVLIISGIKCALFGSYIGNAGEVLHTAVVGNETGVFHIGVEKRGFRKPFEPVSFVLVAGNWLIQPSYGSLK